MIQKTKERLENREQKRKEEKALLYSLRSEWAQLGSCSSSQAKFEIPETSEPHEAYLVNSRNNLNDLHLINTANTNSTTMTGMVVYKVPD